MQSRSSYIFFSLMNSHGALIFPRSQTCGRCFTASFTSWNTSCVYTEDEGNKVVEIKRRRMKAAKGEN